ncbi:MAG: hypothetical protein ABEH83_03730 [Halobacterium sp.]
MRQLDTCDFCGDAAEGVYEVVPASVADGPKRLALCAACRDTLQSVVDPLLDAAGALTGDADGQSDATTRDSSTSGDAERASPSRAVSGTAVDDAIDADSDRETGAARAQSDQAAASAVGDDEAASADGDDEPGDDEDGVTIHAGDDTGSGGPADAEESESADAESETPNGAAAGGSPARRPDGYAQVIRLLQNRDGAMPRDDLRALATNAYDLDTATFEDAVDAAIENGDVEETSGGLQTA